jgi:plasmid maintenance system antidote protein VapI
MRQGGLRPTIGLTVDPFTPPECTYYLAAARADMLPILGTPSRVSEVLKGKKGLSMAMVQRLRARFRVSADLLIPPAKKLPIRRAPKRAAA